VFDRISHLCVNVSDAVFAGVGFQVTIDTLLGVPAGGAAAAARRGCARRPVGTHPHLLVVGAGNLIAVPSMARLGVRRSEIGGCDPRIDICGEASVRRAFRNITCPQNNYTQDLPLG
jgi:hypothetical protein